MAEPARSAAVTPSQWIDEYPSRTLGHATVLPRKDPVVYSEWHEGAPLTQEQAGFYDSAGYLTFDLGLSPASLRLLMGEAKRLLLEEGSAHPDLVIREPGSDEVRSIFRVQTLSETFAKLVLGGRLPEIARFLLGDDVYVHQSRLNYKPGFSGKEFYWHSDFETWHVEDGMPRMRALSMSIALTENNEFNGPLMVMPGSHRQFLGCVGQTPDDHYKTSLQKQEYGVPDQQQLTELAQGNGIVAPKGPAGTVTLFDCNMMHGSNSNISPYPRSNIFVVYNAVSNRLVSPFGGKPPRPEFLAARGEGAVALATFAISFLVRPFGGMFWGPLGDGFGRKSVLAVTILLMSGATACIGLIPSYAQIGFWAPLALVVLRMVQGFSTGGEYGGAATFMAEHAPDKKRGFCGSFLEFGTLGGFSLGALLMLGASLALGDKAMHEWGWRLPYLIAAPMGLVGWYLRSRIDDTPVFREIEEADARHRHPTQALKELLLNYKTPLLALGGMVIALNVVNYTLLSYMPTYFATQLNLTTDEALIVPIVGMLLMMPFLPMAGALSDRLGRKPLWWFSLIGLIVMAVPMYELMATGLIGALFGFAILGLLYVPQLATISATFPAMFPTHVRFAGFAIAYNVSTSIFGGTAPAANDWLIQITGDHLVPAYFMMGSCVIGCLALLFVVETAGISIRGTKPPGTTAHADELHSLSAEH